VTGREGRTTFGTLAVRQSAGTATPAQNLFAGRGVVNVLEQSSAGVIATMGDPEVATTRCWAATSATATGTTPGSRCSKRPVGLRVAATAGAGDFCDGERRSCDLDSTWRASRHLSLDLDRQWDDMRLPCASFIARLYRSRLAWALRSALYTWRW
jgi:hypothetical protein